ncbi:MAG: hypothetical protein B7Z47_03130 [Chthoniobacter sp. 12-60-6]|nr:MAG: hypothetical protein B7Z47_03130 [Chthoniobacter sp. 12-60-6]
MLALLALVILLAWFWPRQETQNDSANSQASKSDQHAWPVRNETINAAPPVPDPISQPVVEVVRADGKRELQAYRIAVRGGVVSLDGQERIAGDFHRRRAPQAWMPGMWCVRLLDASMRVLAEETANAPDERCVVLDPQNQGAKGQPQATQFAGAGEDAMLQVRLPPHPDAKWLKVYRLSSMQRADWSTEPMGRLLASLPLP